MRVLFVDDDPMVLTALARSLRAKRPAWAPAFAGSGAEALVAIERDPVDIVVSDIQMPEMDGVTLMSEVRTRHPQIGRVALSGNIAASTDARAAVNLHVWLAKPCPIKQLCAMIDRLTWARRLIGDTPTLARLMGLAGLPSPPVTFARLSEAMSRHAPASELAAIVRGDPGLVATLLKLVSTSFFGEPEPVTSLDRAIALVGTDRLHAIVLAAELFRAAPHATAIAERGQEVARIAASLAPPGLAGPAIIAGLLHDIGALAVPDGTDDAVLRARVGGVLLGAWGLPLELVGAVAYHRDPEASTLPANPVLDVLARAVVR